MGAISGEIGESTEGLDIGFTARLPKPRYNSRPLDQALASLVDLITQGLVAKPSLALQR